MPPYSPTPGSPAEPSQRAAEKTEIDWMLAQQAIESATCEWASPIVSIPKSDGALRFCSDFRKLNMITVLDTYPLPQIDKCIDSLGYATVFTTLDCDSGYWKIPVHSDDRDKNNIYFPSFHLPIFTAPIRAPKHPRDLSKVN
jgi:hypothetical protein